MFAYPIHSVFLSFRLRLIVFVLMCIAFQSSAIFACSNPTTTLPLQENVENSLLYWSQGTSDDADWSFAATATPTSQTGPPSPFEGGYYAFVEASGSGNPSKNFDLISPCVQFVGEGLPVVAFRYHMYGTDIGSLNLDVSTDDESTWTNVWQESGDQGDVWFYAEVPLKPYLGQSVKFRFRGITGAGGVGDIALDKIIIDKYIFEEPNIACEDGTDINMYYEGLDGNIPITLDITETDGLDSVRVEIVYKGGNPGNTINITDDANNTYSASRVAVGSNASVYSFNLPATSSVTYSDGNSLSNAQSILAYGFRSGQTGKQYVSQFTTIGGFKNTENVFFDLPERDGPQDLTIRVPISEVTYDNRSLNITASAGGVSQTISRTWGPGNAGFPNECCIDVLDFVLEDVPVTATFLQLEIESPQSGGQSYVLAGAVYVEVQCYDPEICVDNIDNDNDGFTDCEDLDCGEVLNRQFDEGLTNWSLYQQAGNTATLSIDNTNKLSGANSALIDISTATGTTWHLQLAQTGHSIENLKTYQVFFDARAEANKVISAYVQKSTPPHASWGYQNIDLTTEPQSFQLAFTADADVIGDISLLFGLANDNTNVWIDNVQFKEVCGVEICEDGIDNDGDGLIDSNDPDCGSFDTEVCYFISDGIQSESGVQDTLYTFNYVTSAVFPIGPTGTYEIESMAMDTVTKRVYAIDGDMFGIINVNTGAFNLISAEVGAALNGADGVVDIDDIDGMTYDHTNNIIWATERRNSTAGNGAPDDLLIKIDPITGFAIPDAFGAGVDYVIVNTPENDLDDIAISDDGTLYAISNFGGSGNQAFGVINKVTGAWTELGDYGIEDVESLAFTATGQLIATTGKDGSNSNELFTIDAGTGIATFVGSISPANDVEACDCISASLINLQLGDRVFLDENGNGIQDFSEPGVPNIVVNLLNGNGTPFLANGVAKTTTTDVLGIYNFDGLRPGEYIVQFTLPSNYTFSPSNQGVDDEVDSDVVTADGRSNIVTLSGSVNDMTVDAGLQVFSVSNSGAACLGTSAQLTTTSSSFIDTWSWTGPNGFTSSVQNPSVQIVNANQAGIYTVTAIRSDNTVLSASTTLQVYDEPEVVLDFNGSVCLTDNSVLTAVPSGGTPEYTYAWTGPNGFESTLQDIDIPTNGNYYATVTDANGCSNSTAGFIYQAYEPFIVNLQTQVCEGDSVSLSVSGSNIQSLQWSPNAGSSTDNAVVVVPSVPSSDYLVTVTSTLGCVATAAASVDVDAAPTVSITGPSSLCIGETSTLSPSSGGYWSIVAGGSNVASVSASGVVTAVGAGTANFYFTDNVTGCRSIDPIAITVKASPEVTWTGASTLCIGETTTLSPTTGGTWVSSNSSIASISQNGTVTAIGAGSATFTFTDSATGCSASSATALVVNGKPLAIVPESLGLCIGETYGASPNTGGTWISTNTAVATISNSGLITAISAGTAAFIFTDSSTGCLSNTSNSITVHPRPTISTGGTDELCIGETFTLSPTSGGTWSSENPVVATVDNSGTVTAIAPGAVRFIFTSTDTGCQSAYSELVVVNDSPTIDLLGNDALCIGSVVTISPTTGGTWTSSDDNKATISNTGTVTAVGAGSVYFTFTHTATGCVSTSTPITIFSDPITVLTGPDEICVGGSTTVLPSSGGSWTSSNSAIATISNAGVVTGMSSGNVQFTYTENASGCQASNVISVDVLSKPIVSISGDNGICVGETTSLSPSSGGYWTSSNGAVASVTSTGIVTGLSQGVVRFTFINDQGCASDETNPVIVYGIPQVFASGPTSGCVGSTLQISPTAGGVWTSSDESIATIINNGTITAVSPGTVTFIYTESASGCTSADSEDFTITAGPTLTNLGDDNLCIGGNANMTPTTGGLWESSDESVLVVDGDGTVTGVGAGTAQLTFTEYATGCAAIYQNDLTVLDPLAIDIIGSDELCVGETTTLSPSTGGFWVSDNTAVATVTSSGVVTALAQGIARFTYTSNSTGCISAPSDPVIVNDLPTISFENSDLICVGGIATLLPATGGSWTTSDPSIATVTNSGVISGVAPGTVSFSFVESSTGCQAAGTLVGTVLEPTDVSVTGPTSICIGSHTTLASAGAGTWISSNPSVASVSTAGLVRGKAPGVVTFSFINSATGCTLGSETEAITVSDCFTQDFNVTLVDEPITSSVATNDNIPTGSTYGQPVLISKPNSSVPALSIAADGTYTFSSSTIGKYYYTVPVCMTPVGYGCANSLLEITVLGNIYDETSISANIDVATVYANYPDTPLEQVLIETTANDRCVNTSGCVLDPTTTVLEGQPSHGTATVNGAGVITYTPDSEFIGIDTVYYQVCETAGENCAASLQIITVADDSAPNSVQAADDFVWLMTNSTTSGNVMTNDGDADGDNISITPQGTAVVPIETAVGSFYIDSDGAYSFTAADGFVGNTEIIYTVCDGQNECTQATLHILVFNDLSLKIRVYLEGALMNNNGDVSSNQRPLMRDDLRVSPYTGENVIPMIDPYTFVINSTNITNNYTKVGPGSLSKYQSITDSSTVFARTGDDAVVDWVFVELRDKNDMYATLGTRSGLVQRDGDVVDLDGVSNLRFPGVSADSFYVVVKHRSHLGAMSLLVANDAFIDFTDVTEEFFNFGTALIPGVDYTGLTFNTTVKPGYNALWAGDFDSNGKVKYENPGDDQNVLFFEVLVNQGNQLGNSNFAFGYGYYNGDYDMNARVKYANPDDDTNMLFAQVLLYPLNMLALSNFNFINEQVPR